MIRSRLRVGVTSNSQLDLSSWLSLSGLPQRAVHFATPNKRFQRLTLDRDVICSAAGISEEGFLPELMICMTAFMFEQPALAFEPATIACE